ncbi:hypothetical protein QTP70_028023 [Hemibagrus guttatus]|uniref:ribonuclease H n=1 Tax=Hemibagrus guttatus TaxID=175788 RepID=A0AAE0UYX9_9TELE|nr:hypothetical protein QTP70_028023 [Hemibagrus guttatus]
MRKSGVAEKYVRVVQDMYERSRTVVRCAVGQTEEFKVEVGLHQGSALSPFLFAMMMDQLSEEVRQESPWTMMFADDIVIRSESREQVEENLERWRFALERRGMKVSRSKTEYMCVNEREGSGTVRLQGEEVKKVQEFKYLGSTVQSNGECEKEVKKRVQAGWNGWRKVSGVLCDQKISARIKGKVYRTVVRPAMLYGLETVSLRKRQESELESTGQMQCDPYDSMLALSSDLKAAQVLTVGSLLIGSLGLLLAFIGGKCTHFMDYNNQAAKELLQPLHIIDAQRREVGSAIYIGWGASVLLLLGGGMLCSTSCSQKAEDHGPSVRYKVVCSSGAESSIQQVWVHNPSQNTEIPARSDISAGAPGGQQQHKTTSEGSKSKTLTTKSEKPMIESERSDGPSKKSQLNHTGSEHSLQSSESEAVSAGPEKTYI